MDLCILMEPAGARARSYSGIRLTGRPFEIFAAQ